ncbi:MAG: biotin/lipoyl-containing protein [Candidatus Omnitrophota bacterium]
MTKIILPELGEGIEKATVSYWMRTEGDSVNEKEDVVEITTDKATFNVTSPCDGILREIVFHEGDTVTVGAVLGIVEEEEK